MTFPSSPLAENLSPQRAISPQELAEERQGIHPSAHGSSQPAGSIVTVPPAIGTGSYLAGDPQSTAGGEICTVDGAQIDFGQPGLFDGLAGFLEIRWDAQGSCQVVGASAGHNPHGQVSAVGGVDDAIDGAIPPTATSISASLDGDRDQGMSSCPEGVLSGISPHPEAMLIS